jgi:hypothetical protein
MSSTCCYGEFLVEDIQFNGGGFEDWNMNDKFCEEVWHVSNIWHFFMCPIKMKEFILY